MGLSVHSGNALLIVMFYAIQIAQVHRATLIDGQQVVVKVQHQGIKTIILKVLHAFVLNIGGEDLQLLYGYQYVIIL